jgi:hypothetical protein
MTQLPVIHPIHSKWTRDEMPQIDDVVAFEAFLRSKGVDYHTELLSTAHLKPTQNEINLTLVFKIVEQGINPAKKLIVSKDGHILDGHNRWYAGKVLLQPVNCIVVDREIDSLLHLAFEFPKVRHSSIANVK